MIFNRNVSLLELIFSSRIYKPYIKNKFSEKILLLFFAKKFEELFTKTVGSIFQEVTKN